MDEVGVEKVAKTKTSRHLHFEEAPSRLLVTVLSKQKVRNSHPRRNLRRLSGYGFAANTMTCMEPFSLVGTITRRVFGS